MPDFTLDIQRRPSSAEFCPPRRTSSVSGTNIADAHRSLRILLGDDRQGVRPDYSIYHNGQELTSPFAAPVSSGSKTAAAPKARVAGPAQTKKQMNASTYLDALKKVQTTLLTPDFVSRLAEEPTDEEVSNVGDAKVIAEAMMAGTVFNDIVLGKIQTEEGVFFRVLYGHAQIKAAASIGFPLRASVVRMPKAKC